MQALCNCTETQIQEDKQAMEKQEKHAIERALLCTAQEERQAAMHKAQEAKYRNMQGLKLDINLSLKR